MLFVFFNKDIKKRNNLGNYQEFLQEDCIGGITVLSRPGFSIKT